jgi:Domain of unknown function (DUF4158)
MKRHWDEQELAEHWSLTQAEFELLRNRTDRSRFGFAALLKFFQVEGRFPSSSKEVPTAALDYLADQLGLSRDGFAEYDLSGRSGERDRAQIRSLVGFRRVTLDDAEELVGWLRREILPADHKAEHLQEAVLDWCRRNRIEPPTPSRIDRIVGSALKTYEADFFAASYERLPGPCCAAMDALLQTPHDQGDDGVIEATPFAELRGDPGRPSLESVLKEISKLQRIVALGLPDTLFETCRPRSLRSIVSEPPGSRRGNCDDIRRRFATRWSRRFAGRGGRKSSMGSSTS